MPCPDTATPTCAPAPTRRRPPRPTPACCASPRPAPLPGPSSCCTTSAPCWRTARRWRAPSPTGRPPACWPARRSAAHSASPRWSAGWRKARRWSAPRCSTAASAREIREHAITHTYANNEAPDGIMRAAARRPGIGAVVRLRQLHPGAGRHAGPGAAAGRAADGLVRIERTPGAGRRQPTTPARAMCRRACCRAARWSIPRRGYARDPESGAVLPPGQSGELKSVRPV